MSVPKLFHGKIPFLSFPCYALPTWSGMKTALFIIKFHSQLLRSWCGEHLQAVARNAIFLLTDSFDYKVEQGNSLLHGNVLPGAEEYTMCFWVRLAKEWVENNNGLDTFADFVALRMKAVSGSDYSIEYQSRGPTSLRIDWDNQRPWV